MRTRRPLNVRTQLAKALRLVRRAKGFGQEDFANVSGRTYLSELERGLKNPTLEKLDALAHTMNVHPLAVLAIAYMNGMREQELDGLLERVGKEARAILARSDAVKPRKAKAGTSKKP